MTQFQQLEAALRRHGLIIGPLSTNDERVIDALLKDIREMYLR